MTYDPSHDLERGGFVFVSDGEQPDAYFIPDNVLTYRTADDLRRFIRNEVHHALEAIVQQYAEDGAYDRPYDAEQAG